MSAKVKDLSQDFVESVVCKETDIDENEMKAFDLENSGQVLLIKQKGILSAIGAYCTHSPNGKLAEGVLGDGHVRCPLHLASFNILNGDIEDFPGVDSLPCYQVTVQDGNVRVRAKKSELQSQKRIKCMSKMDPSKREHFVIIGGGPAGGICVETLRQEGFTGKITMICKENILPYNRVMVSKRLDVDMKKISFRNDEFYKNNDIEVLKGIEAVSVDCKSKIVVLTNNTILEYDKLFIATGLTPLKLDIPGANLKNVITLQNIDDTQYWGQQLDKDKEVIIIGSGFTAMESAAASIKHSKKVTVLTRNDVPFKAIFGNEVGSAVMQAFQKRGILFIQAEPKKCIDDGKGNVTAIELMNGEILKADLVIMGVGSTFNTNFLKDSGIQIRDDGSIEVDQFLKTNIDDVFVGGDIAFAPISLHNNEKTVYSHYSLAHYHGKIAAKNMLNKNESIRYVPHFWTKMSFMGIQHAGHGEFDDIIYHGNVKDLKFAAFYLKDNEVVAVSACDMKPIPAQFTEYLLQGKKLTRSDIVDDKLDWTKKILS